jgi:hypothetical protein
MKIRHIMLPLWVVASGLWLLWSGISWYQSSTADQAQIAAIDECGKFYPPTPEGYVLDLFCKSLPCSCSFPPCLPKAEADAEAQTELKGTPFEKLDANGRWTTWEQRQAKLHPQCAPNVGTIDFVDFIGMHTSDRDAIRQRAMEAIDTLTIATLARGAAVPAGLLIVGLPLYLLMRARKSR